MKILPSAGRGVAAMSSPGNSSSSRFAACVLALSGVLLACEASSSSTKVGGDGASSTTSGGSHGPSAGTQSANTASQGASSGGSSSGAPSGSGTSSRSGITESGTPSSSSGASMSSAGAVVGDGGARASHWVGTWTASPYYDSANQPPASLASSVLRQVAHVSLGGSQVRVQFSNLSGNGPVTIQSAHIALCRAAPLVDSTIDLATDKPLAFSGSASVTIAQGKETWSDAVDFPLPALANVSITTAFGAVPSEVTGHSGSRTTSYLQSGSTVVTAAAMPSAQTFQHWYYISGIDVMAEGSAVGVVAIGDSITDGRGSDNDKNDRWTDILAARLQGSQATAGVAMMNQGIGATTLVGPSATSAQARFDRDVLGQDGVRYAIVYDGVNDIGSGTSFASMKSAYDDLIARAHAHGLLVYGGTITPFDGNAYYSVAHESVRQQANAYIRSGVFDGAIDFDAALTDGGNPPKLQTSYATWAQMDWLHPGPAGYQQMGDTPDLSLFTK